MDTGQEVKKVYRTKGTQHNIFFIRGDTTQLGDYIIPNYVSPKLICGTLLGVLITVKETQK